MTLATTVGSVTIETLSHAGFLFKKGGYTVVVDPFLKDNPTAKKKPSDIRATDILLTHGHFDHISGAAEIAKESGATVTAVFELAAYMAKQGVKTQGLPIGGRFPFDWGTAHFRTAMHSGTTDDGVSFGIAASILFDFGDVKIYHLGDTALHLDFKLVGDVYKPDVVLIPIGGRFTMNIDEAALAVEWLKPKTVIPMHFGTFPMIKADPLEFKKKVESKGVSTVVILSP